MDLSAGTTQRAAMTAGGNSTDGDATAGHPDDGRSSGRRVSRRTLCTVTGGTALASGLAGGRARATVGDCTVVDPRESERFAWVREHPHDAADDASLEADDLIRFGDGYLVGGHISRPVDPSPWLLAVDREGRERWQRTYETGPYDAEGRARATAVASRPGGGAMTAVGVGAPSDSESGTRARLYRIDPTGEKTADVPVDVRWLNGIRADGEGGFLAGGFAWRDGIKQPVVTARDGDGRERWRAELSRASTGSREVTAVVPTSDGGCIAGGAGPQFAAKVTADGTVAWERTYGGGSFTVALETDDGRYRFAGRGPDGVGIVEVDPDGEPVWQRTYGFPRANGLAMAADGYGVLTGADADSDGNLLQITPAGRWSRCWGFDGHTPGAAVAGHDGGVIVAGERFDREVDRMRVVRFDPDTDAGAAATRTPTATPTPAGSESSGGRLPWGLGALVAALLAVVGWLARRRRDGSE